MGPSTAEEIFKRLREQESALNRELARARERAREIVASAGAEAECLDAEAKLALRGEMETLRRQRAAELEVAREAMQKQSEQEIASLRRRAEANRERALAFLLDRVTGRAAT